MVRLAVLCWVVCVRSWSWCGAVGSRVGSCCCCSGNMLCKEESALVRWGFFFYLYDGETGILTILAAPVAISVGTIYRSRARDSRGAAAVGGRD